MRNVMMSGLSMLGVLIGTVARASEAETTATAQNNRWGNGSAAATARYEGDIGFAGTRTRSGDLSLARGVAVGFDEDGLSLSLSNALSSRLGVGIAGNFNLTLGRDGQVAVSSGTTLSVGERHQSASAGGWAGSRRQVSQAASVASGRSDDRGFVRTRTAARQDRAPRLYRPGR